MRRGFVHAIAVIALLLMAGGHVSEMFDHWDHTLQTGRELDYTIVVLVASGAAVFLATKAVRLFSRSSRIISETPLTERLIVAVFVPPTRLCSASPPTLRI